MGLFGNSAEDIHLATVRIAEVTKGMTSDLSSFVLGDDTKPELVPYPAGIPAASVVLYRNGDMYSGLTTQRDIYSVRKKTLNVAWDLYEILYSGQPQAGFYRKNLALVGSPNP